MRIGIGRLLVFVSIILVVGLSWHITGAQSVEEQYFPKTGFWVRGEILRFYNSTPYAEEIYGQPRSIVFKKNENLYMQYFDKACFELYVDPQVGENVQLCDLGARIYEPEKGTPQDIFTTDCREYPETEFGKFEVCSFFLEYYELRGGLAQFGPPISGIEKIGDVYMQYFQNARLEYRPNLLGEENRVVVSDLAIMYFHLIREN